MTSPVIIGDATLYLGDCLDVLPTLGKVDAVVTDPPYGVGIAEWDMVPITQWLPTARMLAPTVYVTPGIKNIADWPRADWIASYAFPIGFKAAMGGGLNAWEPVLIYGRNTLPLDHKQFPPIASEKVTGHPTPKPLAPFRWIINTGTQFGQTICDPFMGSGTTGVACAKLGRKFIGIEIDPGYFDIACDRIRKVYDQPDLFIAPPTKPEQLRLETA